MQLALLTPRLGLSYNLRVLVEAQRAVQPLLVYIYNGQYGDGTPYQLRKPNYSFSGTTPAFYSAV